MRRRLSYKVLLHEGIDIWPTGRISRSALVHEECVGVAAPVIKLDVTFVDVAVLPSIDGAILDCDPREVLTLLSSIIVVLLTFVLFEGLEIAIVQLPRALLTLNGHGSIVFVKSVAGCRVAMLVPFWTSL